MPTAAARACSRQPCPHTTPPPCPVHVHGLRWAGRPSARARGYTGEWDRASKRLRAAGTVCVYCRARPMAQLDHEIPLHQGGSQDPAVNGVPACVECHDIKTRAEGVAARQRGGGRK